MRTCTLPDRDDVWTADEAGIVLEQWQRSGESIAAFARRHGITPARLYWWRKRLVDGACMRGAATAPSLTLVPATVVTASTATVARVEIWLRDGIAIEVADASPSWVAAIVVELERSLP
jgi:transposase-like protein